MVEQDENSAASENTTNSQQQSTTATDELIKTVINPQSQLIIVHLDEDNYFFGNFKLKQLLEDMDLKDSFLEHFLYHEDSLLIKKTRW